MREPRWDELRAEQHLRSLELFGMRFGLERMRRMMTVLGAPERAFDSIHVLGTNGKTSTVRMIAAILQRHGLRTASYTSPHLVSYRERVRVDERELDGERFAAAVARAARAAERVNRTLAGAEHVTQFELLTAAAFWEMARAEVQVAAVEAGLGGRYDATSVIAARVTVLTNVALEHTRWLGPTVRDIAEEKLAVLREGTTLVHGADLAPEARDVAARVARERSATVVEVTPAEVPPLAAAGRFQRQNFALARAAAEAYLARRRQRPDARAVADAARTEVAGRLEVVASEPLTVLDGAHNPHAVAALVGSLPELIRERPLALVMGVLEDKDAAGMLSPLLEISARAWFTAPPSERALSPAALHSRARQIGYDRADCEEEPARALAEAQRWAREHRGAVLVTGSVYLVGAVLEKLDLGDAPRALEAARKGVGG
jgi:dihydrofolate synthase/folylpolyglutamate synthase